MGVRLALFEIPVAEVEAELLCGYVPPEGGHPPVRIRLEHLLAGPEAQVDDGPEDECDTQRRYHHHLGFGFLLAEAPVDQPVDDDASYASQDEGCQHSPEQQGPSQSAVSGCVVQWEEVIAPYHHHREVHPHHEELALGEVTVALDLVGQSEADRNREVGRRPSQSGSGDGNQIECNPRIVI